MQPSSFDESNTFLNPPDGMTPEQVQVLSVYQGINDRNAPVTISCWKPDSNELREINKTGRVWLSILGHRVPPVWIDGFSPFTSEHHISRQQVVGIIVGDFDPCPSPNLIWSMVQAKRLGVDSIRVFVRVVPKRKRKAIIDINTRVLFVESLKFVDGVEVISSDEDIISALGIGNIYCRIIGREIESDFIEPIQSLPSLFVEGDPNLTSDAMVNLIKLAE